MSTKPSAPPTAFGSAWRTSAADLAAIGLIAGAVVPADGDHRILTGWDTGVLIYLIAVAAVMTRCASVEQIRQRSGAGRRRIRGPDPHRRRRHGQPGRHLCRACDAEHSARHYGIYAALAMGTIVLSWTFIHTIFALHYAHEYYGERRHRTA